MTQNFWKESGLCESCFEPMERALAVCPHCGYNAASPLSRGIAFLPIGTCLKERYVIGRMLGAGGFGITYLAYDRQRGERVAVKEYFPSALASRSPDDIAVIPMPIGEREEEFHKGAQKFYEEAEMISRFNGDAGIIKIFDFFYQNHTAYYVMEYLDGVDLARYMAKRERRISEGELLYFLERISAALMRIHEERFLHRDISPDNIFICRNGEIKLIDFGVARRYVSQMSQSMSVIVKVGFTPIEQYQRKGNQGPWTDIYALGATAYYMMTGRKPDDALSRANLDELDFTDVPFCFVRLLRKMLAVQPSRRYRNVTELRHAMAQIKTARVPLLLAEASASRTRAEKLCETCKKPQKRKLRLLAWGCVLLILLGAGVFALPRMIPETVFSDGEQNVYSEGLSFVLWQGTYAVQGIGLCTDPNIVIPSEYNGIPVTAVENYAFKNCEQITSVTLPDSVTAIGDCAFWGCRNLRSVHLPDGVTSIGVFAFRDCEELNEIRLPQGITRINDYTFCGCKKLETITLTGTIESIGNGAFRKSGVEQIHLPEGLKYIGENAFQSCGELASITLPASVTQIDTAAFADCRYLSTIYYKGTRGRWEAMGQDPDSISEARVICFGDTDDEIE